MIAVSLNIRPIHKITKLLPLRNSPSIFFRTHPATALTIGNDKIGQQPFVVARTYCGEY